MCGVRGDVWRRVEQTNAVGGELREKGKGRRNQPWMWVEEGGASEGGPSGPQQIETVYWNEDIHILFRASVIIPEINSVLE